MSVATNLHTTDYLNMTSVLKTENIICIRNKIIVKNIFTNLEQELKNLENNPNLT